VGFPSGQREQTVNLSAKPSEVRILPPPPILAESIVGDFGLTLGIDSNYMTSCMKWVSILVGIGLVSLFAIYNLAYLTKVRLVNVDQGSGLPLWRANTATEP
jgi:hypothetical protein